MATNAIVGEILVTLLWVFIIAIVGLGAFLMVRISQYKHKAIIKNVANSTKINTLDKFRIIKKSDGTVWWRLLKGKRKLLPAPKECIEVTNKGRMIVTWYKVDSDNYIPASDSYDWKNEENEEWLQKTIQPYTTEERSLMIEQHRKAEREKKKSIGELLAVAAPYMAIVLILVCFMIFYGEAVEPMKEVGAQYIEVANKLEQASENLADAIGERQRIDGEITAKLNDLNVSSPPN